MFFFALVCPLLRISHQRKKRKVCECFHLSDSAFLQLFISECAFLVLFFRVRRFDRSLLDFAFFNFSSFFVDRTGKKTAQKKKKRERNISLSLCGSRVKSLSLSLSLSLLRTHLLLAFENVQPRRDDAFFDFFFVRPTPIREREEVNKFGGQKCLHGG